MKNKIGEIGHFVEIDKSGFSEEKYNVYRSIRSSWIVNGFDFTSNKIIYD